MKEIKLTPVGGGEINIGQPRLALSDSAEGHAAIERRIRRSMYRTPDGARHIAGFHVQQHWAEAEAQMAQLAESELPLLEITDLTRSGDWPSQGGGTLASSEGIVLVNGRAWDGGSHAGTSSGYRAMARETAILAALDEAYAVLGAA